MNDHFLSIDIHDEASFVAICDHLHDAECCLSEVRYDQAAGTWTVTFAREFLEDPNLIERRRTCLVFTRLAFPKVESVLSLSGVKAYEVIDNARIDTFIFNKCMPDDGAYRCLSATGDEMIFTFSGEPTGSLRDVRLLGEQGSYITWGWSE